MALPTESKPPGLHSLRTTQPKGEPQLYSRQRELQVLPAKDREEPLSRQAPAPAPASTLGDVKKRNIKQLLLGAKKIRKCEESRGPFSCT